MHACLLPYEYVENSILFFLMMWGVRAAHQKKAGRGEAFCLVSAARWQEASMAQTVFLVNSSKGPKPLEASDKIFCFCPWRVHQSPSIQCWVVRARGPTCLPLPLLHACTRSSRCKSALRWTGQGSDIALWIGGTVKSVHPSPVEVGGCLSESRRFCGGVEGGALYEKVSALLSPWWGKALKPWAASGPWETSSAGTHRLSGKRVSILLVPVEFNFGKWFIKIIWISFGTSQSRLLKEMLMYLGILKIRFHLFCFTV